MSFALALDPDGITDSDSPNSLAEPMFAIHIRSTIIFALRSFTTGQVAAGVHESFNLRGINNSSPTHPS